MARNLATLSLSALLVPACAIGGGDQSWSFDASEITGVSARLHQGELSVRPLEDGDGGSAWVDFSGGGIGRHVMPTVQLDDGVLLVDADCKGACGGELALALPADVPLLLDLDRGELRVELAAPASVSACVGTGELDLVLPTGGYLLDLDGSIGEIQTSGIWHDPDASHAIHACVGIGELSVTGVD